MQEHCWIAQDAAAAHVLLSIQLGLTLHQYILKKVHQLLAQ
jgi:hypothetical protein